MYALFISVCPKFLLLEWILTAIQVGEPYGEGLLIEGHIRLLLLKPDQPDRPIRCTISTGLAADWAKQYFALSYTWGSKDDMQEVICNGSPMKVTRSLFDALHSFRQIEEPIRLWVDALCINQQNDEERGQVVKTMTEIYRNASFVICHGLALASTSSTSLAVTLIQSLVTKGLHLGFHDIINGSIPWSALKQRVYHVLWILSGKPWISL